MADRFELEQQLLSCWNIIEDLKDIDESQKFNLIESIVNVYNFKFEKMFDTFEECIKSEFSYRKQLVDLKKEHEQELKKQRDDFKKEIYNLREQMVKEPFKHYTGSYYLPEKD